MRLIRRIAAILYRGANVFRQSTVQREIDAELEAHIAMRIEDNLAAGMEPESARRDAYRRFGDSLARSDVGAIDVELGEQLRKPCSQAPPGEVAELRLRPGGRDEQISETGELGGQHGVVAHSGSPIGQRSSPPAAGGRPVRRHAARSRRPPTLTDQLVPGYLRRFPRRRPGVTRSRPTPTR